MYESQNGPDLLLKTSKHATSHKYHETTETILGHLERCN
jgi:hypothetical protein